MVREWPRVEWVLSGATHTVYAGGSAADGSLHDFFTLCGRHVRGDTGAARNRWRERGRGMPSCKRCRHCLRTARRVEQCITEMQARGMTIDLAAIAALRRAHGK